MQEKEPKSEKKKKITLKELYATEKGRALLFFGFYFVFFFVVILLLRTSRSATNEENKKTYDMKVTYSYQLELLKQENYHYKYLTTVGENVFLYEGDRYDQKESFTVTGNGSVMNYFRDGDLFIKQENGLWNMADNPYLLPEFYEIDKIQAILEKAKFVSKTQYENGESELKFAISSEKLQELLTGQEINLPTDTNEILLKLDSSKNVVAMEYDLTSYETNQFKIPTKAEIELTFSNFGKIKKIERPS